MKFPWPNHKLYPLLTASIEVVVVDAHGKVVYRHTQPSRSYLAAFLAHIRTALRDVGEGAIVDIAAASHTLDTPAAADTSGAWLKVDPPSGTNRGIVIGTSTVAVALLQSRLQALITDGAGAGQMDYLTTQTISVMSSGGDSFTIDRQMNNNSGGSITVAEAGINVATEVGTVDKFFCIVRDLLSPSVAVADTQGIRITYTIKIAL